MANPDLRTVFRGDFATLELKNEATLRAYSMQEPLFLAFGQQVSTRRGLMGLSAH